MAEIWGPTSLLCHDPLSSGSYPHCGKKCKSRVRLTQVEDLPSENGGVRPSTIKVRTKVVGSRGLFISWQTQRRGTRQGGVPVNFSTRCPCSDHTYRDCKLVKVLAFVAWRTAVRVSCCQDEHGVWGLSSESKWGSKDKCPIPAKISHRKISHKQSVLYVAICHVSHVTLAISYPVPFPLYQTLQ